MQQANKRVALVSGANKGIGLLIAKDRATSSLGETAAKSVASDARAIQPDVTSQASIAAAAGTDVILSTSNSTKSMVDSIQGLRPDGRFVAMGADAEPLSVPLIDLISKRIRIIGSQQNGPEYLHEALDFLAQGRAERIFETYPLAEAQKAYQRVADGRSAVWAALRKNQETDGTVTAFLSEPVLVFIPDTAHVPTLKTGQRLSVEVTIPAQHPPCPIRLGIKENGSLTPLTFE